MCFCRIVSCLYDESGMSVYKLTRKFELDCLADTIRIKLMKNTHSAAIGAGMFGILKSFGETSSFLNQFSSSRKVLTILNSD